MMREYEVDLDVHHYRQMLKVSVTMSTGNYFIIIIIIIVLLTIIMLLLIIIIDWLTD